MTDTAIIRFDSNGPADTGLERWEDMDPRELLSGSPVQNGHVYHEIETDGYIAGVWDCTAFTARMEPYSVDEFMLLLEGQVIMRTPDGADITINAGEAFVIPKGLTCQWIQPGYVRKFFMILDRPFPERATNPSLTRVTVPDLTAAAPLNGAVSAERVDFQNAAGHMQTTVSTHGYGRAAPAPATSHELIQVLNGTLTLTTSDATERFIAGETAYVLQGADVGRETANATRLLTARYRR